MSNNEMIRDLTPTPDNNRIDRLIDWAEASAKAQDGAWDQHHWAIIRPCGTSYCIAGKVLEEEGVKFIWSRVSLNSVGSLTVQADHEGTPKLIPLFAQEVLGLIDAEADALFKGSNSIDDLKLVAKKIRDGDYRGYERIFLQPRERV